MKREGETRSQDEWRRRTKIYRMDREEQRFIG